MKPTFVRRVVVDDSYEAMRERGRREEFKELGTKGVLKMAEAIRKDPKLFVDEKLGNVIIETLEGKAIAIRWHGMVDPEISSQVFQALRQNNSDHAPPNASNDRRHAGLLIFPEAQKERLAGQTPGVTHGADWPMRVYPAKDII
ncbi:hypothetical protein JCM11641_004436 [Rhodosporidiobolus odoratus]